MCSLQRALISGSEYCFDRFEMRLHRMLEFNRLSHDSCHPLMIVVSPWPFRFTSLQFNFLMSLAAVSDRLAGSVLAL